METKRPYYRTKAAWAKARAEEARQRAADLPYVESANWRGVRARMGARTSYYAEAAKFDRMTERFAATGV